MTSELSVRGVGGIKDAEITLNGNFIVITGESGSGKSSLVRAMEFISGKRAQSAIINVDEEAAEVRLVTETERDYDLPEEYKPQEKTVIVKRIFDRKGKGRCYLQNTPITLSGLVTAMEREIVIQSQFAQLGLLDGARQLELVDSRGGKELLNVKDELAKTFKQALEAEKKLVTLKKRRTDTENRYQNGAAICNAIRSLGLQPDRNSAFIWGKKLRDLEEKAAKLTAIKNIEFKLNGFGGEGGILDELDALCKEVPAVLNDSENCTALAEKTLSAAQNLSAEMAAVTKNLMTAESIEEAKVKTETKLGTLRKIKRTIGINGDRDLLEYAEEAEREMDWLKRSHIEIEDAEKTSAKLKGETAKLAVQLRALRESTAKKLENEINRHLSDMSMDDLMFEIKIEGKDKVRATGADDASFMLRMPDSESVPVKKTASGGELSRILIALQLVCNDEQLPGILVFDEVEAGLGGKTALLAGKKLCELSKRCQTVLITHEATIAAMADQHFLVRRENEETLVEEISGDKRQREIARMLSGDESSQEALDHAKALLGYN